jgi:hypothetical protein
VLGGCLLRLRLRLLCLDLLLLRLFCLGLLRLLCLCLLRLCLLCLLRLDLLGAPRRLRLEKSRLPPTAALEEARGATKRKAPRRTLRTPAWSCLRCLCGFAGRGGCS